MSTVNTPPLEFNGERFTPECQREIWYEHWHRYAFARELVQGKRVLDAACGEGYGSAMLAGVAQAVLGVDISDSAVEHARARYGAQTNLRFAQGDATALDLPAASFDVVTSFETLEHVHAHDELVAGFARVLSDDGVLLISSPDKLTYSDISGFRNEFHVRELYRDELLVLLRRYFPAVRLYGQKLLFQSVLWALDEGDAKASGHIAATAAQDGLDISESLDYAPLYFIAVCSKRELPLSLPGLALFGDREESVYAHYNHEVRKNMAAGGRIAELEAELDTLRNETAKLPAARAVTAEPHVASSIKEPRPWWRGWR
ncbi:class I SAM-dependent methyltransferase [Pseudolysobacter antarcticus]|uniref:Class I SAM-dependent methyltransferase n=1 Tax=Pseudolysobacter antarcticus TaxID=2511995 RepID=A0A411HGE1_9GAMM|nr:class I SAM-dependent methyltransferase [Pseudolysobacter antarcticus]QBB69521.1 class I SAM-dependent methyltransferase [Pseudolysobacter antarcticus]